MEDKDYAFALSLQNELFTTADTGTARKFGKKRERPTSVVDDSWETIDPTPDIRQLFLEFNDAYFEGKLAGCEVKWSSKMTLCAGLCCYEGRGGLCSIKLSIPLLKLRPRKDLVQTLLHEMIHALLFVTHNNKDHNAHGPEFHKHMYRINQQTGANITVYHNFHDEVDLYRQHWWRCTGSCKKLPPYYGYVKRAMNRAPSPRDPWWSEHQLKCGGTYVKVKEPEDYGKKKRKIKEESASSTSQPNSSGSGMRKIYDLWRKDSSSDDDAFKKGKENDVQKSNDVRLVNPFSGKGYVLGTVKKEISTVSRSCVENDSFTRTDKSPFKSDKSIICEESGGIPSKNIKTAKAGHVKKFTGSMQLEVRNKLENNDVKQREKLNIHEQLKKRERAGTNNELTIIDEFKRVGEAQKRSVVIVEDDTPAKHVQLVYDLVPCPVCQTKVEKDLINSHLDGCLT